LDCNYALLVTIFGVSWDELALQHVQTFLDDADDEPYLWEAKGGGQPQPKAVRKAVCGFANTRGGWLILGADRRNDGSWALDGFDFRREEPRTWVDAVIRDGMNPVPDHDTKPLATQNGTHVGVVQVAPVEEPPCITRDGVIWQRVSGRTIPVTDPSVLARLYEQGERAGKRAADDATEMLELVLDRNANPWIYEPSTMIFALGVATVAYPEWIDRRLYTPEMKDRVTTLFRDHLKPDRHRNFDGPPQFRVLADGIQAQKAGQAFEARWTLTARKTGAVARTCTLHRDQEGQVLGIELLMEDVVRPAWEAAAEVIDELGGFGRGAYWMRTLGRITLSHRGNFEDLGHAWQAGWTAHVAPTNAELEYAKRQLLRSAGFEEWEPEAEEGQ
jgi:hypothetical protein